MVLSRLQRLLRGAGKQRRKVGVARPGEFFRSGIQYYLAGRLSFNCRHYPPVTANLFHLAFEVMFKTAVLTELYRKHEDGWSHEETGAERHAAVVRYAQECDRELRSKIGHNLVRAWNRFKRHHHKVALLQFDQVVSNLDRWRVLRYPELPLAGDGIVMGTNPAKGPTGKATGADGKPMTMYHLSLEDMDELFAASAVLEFSLSALRTSIEGRAGAEDDLGMATYKLNNKHALF